MTKWKKLKQVVSTLARVKELHKVMPTPALRAVVLDNDETTGCYTLLFAITITLKHFGYTDEAFIPRLIRLGKWMNLHHCFRPGLTQLLRTLISLRENNKIDSVIMYTNQKVFIDYTKITEPPKIPPYLSSVPECIAFLMNEMAGQPVFDHILVRPARHGVPIGAPIPKHFSRVLNLYPDRPKDIRDIVFVDDMAYPAYVSAEGIPRCSVEESSWYAIEPYRKQLLESDVLNCLEYVFGDLNTIEEYVGPILSYVLMNQRDDVKSSTPNATIFITLTHYLQKKFGWAPKRFLGYLNPTS